MFDNGLSEWVLVVTVALLVLGLQRALAIVKVEGVMVGKAKAAMAQIQEQVHKELPSEELVVVQKRIQEMRCGNAKRKITEVLGLEKKADTTCVSPSSVSTINRP